MKKKIKVLFICLILLISVGGGGYFLYIKFFKKSQSQELAPIIQVTNTIEKYNYNLEDRDTSLFKEKFEKLKELLNEEYDKEEYISLISELFIIDLYTISNKVSRYDIGGLEYVYSQAVESFKTVSINSIYKTVENNIDGTRTQDLPEVNDIKVNDISDYTFVMPDESEVDGVRVKLTWDYVKDLGYDTQATIVLIPDGEKMSIVYLDTK